MIKEGKFLFNKDCFSQVRCFKSSRQNSSINFLWLNSLEIYIQFKISLATFAGRFLQKLNKSKKYIDEFDLVMQNQYEPLTEMYFDIWLKWYKCFYANILSKVWVCTTFLAHRIRWDLIKTHRAVQNKTFYGILSFFQCIFYRFFQ